MKKILLIILLFPSFAFAQSVGSFWKIESATSKMGKDLPAKQLIRYVEQKKWYVTTVPIPAIKTMQLAIDSGYVVEDPGDGTGQWLDNGSSIYYNGGNVGIGTSTPSTALDVNGVVTATGGNSTNWNTAYGWGNHAAKQDSVNNPWKYLGGNTIQRGTGKVGIGRTNPTATLEVNSKSASAPQFRTYNSVLGEATPTDSLGIFITPNGKVGIGTTNPTYILSVGAGTVALDDINVTISRSAQHYYYSGPVTFGNRRSDAASALALYSNNIESVRIDPSQRVGIGVTNPAYKLHVDAGVAQAGYFKSTASYGVQGVSTSYPGVYGLSTNGYGVYGASTTNHGVYGYSQSGVAGQFTTTSGYAGIFMGGNVGIGTTNPSSYTLSVNGSIYGNTGVNGLTTIGSAINGSANGSGFGGYFQTTTGSAIKAHATSGGTSGIFTGGKVGIGTTNPDSTLSVNGSLSVTGDVRVDKSIFGGVGSTMYFNRAKFGNTSPAGGILAVDGVVKLENQPITLRTPDFFVSMLDDTLFSIPFDTLFGSIPTTGTTDSCAWYDRVTRKMYMKKIASSGSMTYPGSGIAVSTGSAWGTSITNNSSDWNTVTSKVNKADSTGNAAGNYVTHKQLGGKADTNNATLRGTTKLWQTLYNIPTSGDDWSGDAIILKSKDISNIGSVYYLESGELNPCVNTSYSSCPNACFMAVEEAGEGGGDIKVITRGIVYRDDWEWISGTTLYVGNSDGTLTMDIPANGGEVIAPVAVALTGNSVYFFGCVGVTIIPSE